MRIAASITFMFTELPLLDRFEAARNAGFDGVEIQRWMEGDPGAMARAARDAGLAVALINVPSGSFTTGGDGCSGVPGREEEFREVVRQTFEVARELDASAIHLGPSRIPAGLSRDECLRCYIANVQHTLELNAGGERLLLVEAMNTADAPTALFASTAAATQVVEVVAHPGFRQQFDVYHSAMTGEEPLAAYRSARHAVAHVQFADAPGKQEPGSGRLDVPAILRGIIAEGYDGWLGAEYRPRSHTEHSLAWLRPLRAAVLDDA